MITVIIILIVLLICLFIAVRFAILINRHEFQIKHYTFSITAGLEINTPIGYKLQVVGIDVSKSTSIVFEVKACNDAHLLLMRDPEDEENGVLHIIIGMF